MKSSLTTLSAALVLANSALINAAQTNDTIFISAKAPIAAQEFSGAVSVVTAQEIKASGARNVAEALEGVPGVVIGAGGGTAGSEIRIRGMAAEYSLILVDGKRIPNASRNISGSPVNRTNWVAISNIERIEVIRGAASNLYGADAFSGVINIITKKPTDKWQSSITLSASNIVGEGGKGGGINVSTGGKINQNMDFSLNLDRQSTDGILNANGSSQRADSTETNAQIKLGIDFTADDRLDLTFLTGRDKSENNSYSSYYNTVSNEELNQDKSLFGADYSSKIASFNSKVSLSVADSKIDDNGDEWNLKDSTLGWALDGAVGKNQYISAGIDHRVEKADRNSLNFEDTFKSTSVYVQDVVDIGDSNALTFGFSYEDHNKYGTAFSPKVYWSSQLDEQLSIKVGYSEGRISPAIREGSSNYVVPAGTRVYAGNDDLQPEENKTVELGFSYITESVDSSITFFNSNVNNLITTASGGTDSLGRVAVIYSNVNKAKVRGVESNISWKIQPGSVLSFNYTYTDATDESGGSSDGHQIGKRPKHVANLKYTQHIASVDTNVSLSLKGVSSQYTSTANTDEIDGHGIVNLGMVKAINDNFDLSASVINLTDREVLDGSDAIYSGREFRLSVTGRF